MLVEIVAGQRHGRRARRARRGVRPPDRQAAAAGEERAGLPRQPRARAVPDGGDALRRRGHCARDRRRGGARVRHADGSDRARRHRRARHLRRGRQACSVPDARAAAKLAELRCRGQPRQEDRRGLLRVGRRQAAEARRRRAVPAGLADGWSIRSSPKRRPRSRKASSTTPTSSTPARYSAPGSRRSAAARCITRARRRTARKRRTARRVV